jgi:tetratricopeptide (TPR) repeat protein/DNA-binding XRE family transcriptional regulator
VDVRPGSVREARLEAGLTLEQVARGEVSRAAIHLVETGKARPSMRTLEHIAQRTGKPIAFFLADGGGTPRRSVRGSATDPGLDHLEQLALAGEWRALRDTAYGLLPPARGASEEALVRYYLGRAQLELKDAEGALENFRRARTLFQEIGDAWMVVECMDGEAGGLYMLERREALELAEAALRECRKLSPVPLSTEVRILGHLGAIQLTHHQWGKAVAYYEEAVRAAGALRDLSRLARMYNDLSIAYQEMGNLTRAASYSHKALAIYGMQQDHRSIAQTENNLGLVLMKQGDLDGAERHISASLAIFDEVHMELGKSHVLLSMGELYLYREAFGQAEDYITQALDLAERLGESMTAALALQFLGRLAARAGHDTRTDQVFTQAIALLTALGVTERLVEAEAQYAEILGARGEKDLAIEHWRRAMAASRPHAVQADTTRVTALTQESPA